MHWIALSLLAPALNTVANFLDKYIIGEKIKDSRGLPIYVAVVALIFGTAAWFVGGFPVLSVYNGLIVMGSGFCVLAAYVLYFSALSKSHTSYIIAIFQTIPLFTLVLSLVFLQERLSAPQLVGFFVMFVAVMALSLERDAKKFKLNDAFYLMLGASFLLAAASVMIKFAVDLEGFVPILAYESWGVALGGFVLFLLSPPVRGAFLQSFTALDKPTLGVMFANESLVVISKAVTFLAITAGPVSLVSVLGGAQVFYGIVLGGVLTLLWPKIFKEDITRHGFMKRIIFSVVLLVGIVLVAQP